MVRTPPLPCQKKIKEIIDYLTDAHLFDVFRDEITSITIVHRKSFYPSESVLYILALILLQQVKNPLKKCILQQTVDIGGRPSIINPNESTSFLAWLSFPSSLLQLSFLASVLFVPIDEE